MTDFTGLVAIVTGGASGIGAATADVLAARGASVAVLDRDGGASGRRGGPDAGPALSLRCDVQDTAAVNESVATVASQLGGIDIVINNAGIGAVGDVAANEDDEWHRV